MYFLVDSLSPSPSSLEATLKEKNLLPLRVTPKFEVIQFAPLK